MRALTSLKRLPVLLAALVALAIPGTASAQIQLIQTVASGGGPVSGYDAILPVTADTGQGNELVLSIGAAGRQIHAVTDSAGNTYTENAVNNGTSVWSALITNRLLVGDTITASLSAPTSTFSYAAEEYSGINETTPVDATTNATISSGTSQTITTTTTQPDDMILSVTNELPATGGGYLFQTAQIQNVGAPGPYSQTWTWSGTVKVALSAQVAFQEQPANGQLFSTGSVFNQPVPATAPLDPGSAAMSSYLGTLAASEETANTGPNAMTNLPIFQVPATQPCQDVTLTERPDEQAPFDCVPLPSPFFSGSGGDNSAVVWQPSTNKLWEIYALSQNATTGAWSAEGGGAMDDVSSDPGYFSSLQSSWLPYNTGAWGVAASRTSLAGGTMMASDMCGNLACTTPGPGPQHALAINLPWACGPNVFSWPATASDGTLAETCIPEGAHLRLNPSFNVSTLSSPLAQMLATALEKYGAIVRDQTGQDIGLWLPDWESSSGYADWWTNPGWPLYGVSLETIIQSLPWDDMQVLQMTPGSAGIQ